MKSLVFCQEIFLFIHTPSISARHPVILVKNTMISTRHWTQTFDADGSSPSAQPEMMGISRNTTISPNNTMDDKLEYFVWYLLPTVLIVPPLGLPTNGLVIRLLLGKPGICSTSEIFTLNLALFDMLFCFLVLAEYIRFLFKATFEAANFLVWGLNQAGGPLLLCMSAVDSYIAVCHPLIFIRLKDPTLRLSLCLVVTAMTASCCCLVKVSSRYKWNVILVLLSCCIVIISTCNILIMKSLRQSGPSGKEVHPVKRRAVKLVMTAFALVNLHYLPPLTEYLLREFGPEVLKPFSVLTCVTYFLLSMGSFLQPLSYLIRTKQLHKMKCHCGSTA